MAADGAASEPKQRETDGDELASASISLRLERDIRLIDAAAWDACAGDADPSGRPENPFLTHRFLAALEESGSVSAATGWGPHHLVAEHQGRIVGVTPLYVKSHSQGEYVFDYGWADAFQRAGGRYYPKLQASVPFTPATGRRFLADPASGLDPLGVEAALAEGACRICAENNLSSLHVTFCTEAEWTRFGGAADGEDGEGMLRRQDQQFHWVNRGYANFDDFLGALASRKRKQLKKERAKALESGVEIVHLTGDALEPAHWDAFFEFYQDTGARKWGTPYLNRAFFDLVQRDMRDDVLLMLCRRQGRWVAGALNFVGCDTLYGRYWGCVEDHPFLHFETCYYQAIDAALALGLERVEAGAQGAHKLARGYEPTATYSLHWISNPSFRRAVAHYLRQERAAVTHEIEALAAHTPFKQGQDPDQRRDPEGGVTSDACGDVETKETDEDG